MPQTRIEPIYREMGEVLARLRALKGLSQAQVGSMLSPPVTRASIANLENGKQRILFHTLADLARIYGVQIEEILADLHGENPAEEKAPSSSSVDIEDLTSSLRSALSLPEEQVRNLANRLLGTA